MIDVIVPVLRILNDLCKIFDNVVVVKVNRNAWKLV